MDSKSAARTLEIFEAFAAACRPLTLTELSEALEMPLSSCLHLLRTLERHGYAYSLGRRQGYYPTRRMLQHAEAIAAHDPILKILGPRMADLRDRTQETIVLAQRVEKQAVILESVPSRQAIRYSVDRGDLRPLHSTALGKALLGSMEAESRAALLKKLVLDRMTPRTLTDRADLERHLAECEARGWYYSDSENVEDLYAVTVHLRFGATAFAVGVAGPYARMRAKEADHVRNLLAFKTGIEHLTLPAAGDEG